jgi:sortase B
MSKKHLKFVLRSLIFILSFLISLKILNINYNWQKKQIFNNDYQKQLSTKIISPTIDPTATVDNNLNKKSYKSPIDFTELSKTNKDTIAWLKIPDTKIDYPVVKTNDNEKYLHIDFEGKNSIYGTIYLDYESKSDFSGFNNIFYGHNMKDGSMFKDIVNFKDKSFFEGHRDIYIYTNTKMIHLKTIAAFFDNSNAIARKTSFRTQEEFELFLDSRLKKCAFAKKPNGKILSIYTFITCSYEFNDARTFLYAVESNMVDN